MINNLKRGRLFIFVLFVSLILPFNVRAKQTNTYIIEAWFDNEELISGDTVRISDVATYVPVEEQEFRLFYENKVTNFEYYIIDSIDSKGNIKYKKYDFSDSNKNDWYPDSSTLFDSSGGVYSYRDPFPDPTNIDYYNLCKKGREFFNAIKDDYHGMCNLILPAINENISRWKFDSIDYGDAVDVEVCKFQDKDDEDEVYYTSCDSSRFDSRWYTITNMGAYKYFSSYKYKFYEIPWEPPKLRVTCDTNELKDGETTSCKVNFSYKYNLSYVWFAINSDKLIIDNFQERTGWVGNYVDNSILLSYYVDKLTNDFVDDTEIASFDITADGDVDNILASLTAVDFRYIDKTGENNVDDFTLDVDLGKDVVDDDIKDSNDDKDSKDSIGDISNPETFRDSCYLLIGILIIGGISFIQLKSKRKIK